MKEKIMAKLFNNEELTSEEMVYIGKNLQDNGFAGIPFNHEKENTLEACGVAEEDFNALNKIMKEQMEDKKDGFKGASEAIEKIEQVALSNPKFLRIILMNHIRLMFQSQHPLLSILMGLGKH